MAKRPIPVPSAADGDDPDALAPHRTLIERAYTQLRDDIIRGVLAPGDKLRVEHLKARYEVGAGTLREAITRLVSDALVEAEGQRGFRVAPMTLADLNDLTELRVHIELQALRQSIRRGGEAWRQEVRAAYEALSAVEQPVSADRLRHFEALNTRFHEALISAQASPWTLKVLRLLGRHGERYRRLSVGLTDHTGRDVHSEHRQIYERAMAGQEASAALALEAHIRNTSELLQQAYRQGTTPMLDGSAGPGGAPDVPPAHPQPP